MQNNMRADRDIAIANAEIAPLVTRTSLSENRRQTHITLPIPRRVPGRADEMATETHIASPDSPLLTHQKRARLPISCELQGSSIRSASVVDPEAFDALGVHGRH